MRVRSRPTLTQGAFTRILIEDLNIQTGDIVFVHSSIDQLSLDFQFGRVLSILQQVLGPKGTLLFPTFPRLQSYEFLKRGEVFDVRTTPSHTGVLAEIARRHPNAVRSLHPTKSVCAIGRYARELVSAHQQSPYPYDSCSPYHKLAEYGGKLVGIGVSTDKLSFVHCVDDALKERFPLRVYHDQIFPARCINYDGKEEIVPTYAHNMRRMNLRTREFIKKHIDGDVCKDLTIGGTEFFHGDASRLLPAMIGLALQEITIYSRLSFYPSLMLPRPLRRIQPRPG